MEVKETNISGLLELMPNVYEDERGFFFESFNQEKFNELVPSVSFVQDNQSFSVKNVLRGLHFQVGSHAQAKLVRVIAGKVLDVAVDLRKGSSTYGEHVKVILDSSKNNLVFIPEGFAHGFMAIEPSVFSYKCSSSYNKESEGGILWNDPDLGIDWGVKNPIVSVKDQQLGLFKDI